ncbi:hypothetical protein KSS87_013550 [Heliosperma pusillum]|nr:hypothetical protein KSS87_013550 [Heliosperma pusillum]
MGQRAEDSFLGSWMLGKSREMGTSPWNIQRPSSVYHTSTDASLFSSSLPVLPHEKLIMVNSVNGRQTVDDGAAILDKVDPDIEGNDILDDDILNRTVGFVLPGDEDDLFADIANDYEFAALTSQVDDTEENDFFGNLGGMELGNDFQENLSLGMAKVSLSDGMTGNGMISFGAPNGVGTVAGEHPYGEHPSRTLFVRNINSNVEDSELKSLFEQYGDIRTLYTACKHRGFVMISYYDIRHARLAMRGLQNRPLRRRKLDIHFSIPKDNPSEKDINQGTLVVFNLDPSVTNEDLRQIFGAYGEVKEIRETPHKKHHKFIEYYDVRAAEAALRALNRSDIAGKRIKLEPSRPGGTRRNLMLQLNQDVDHDESRFQHHAGSPIASSPPGNWMQFGSPAEHNNSPMHSLSRSPGFRTMSPTTNNHLSGLASILHPQSTSSPRLAPIGKDLGRGGHVEHMFGNSNPEKRASLQHPHSFPELNLVGQFSGTISSFGASSSNGSTIETLSGPQFLWGSPTTNSEKIKSAAWQTHSVGNPQMSNGPRHGFPFANRHAPYLNPSQHHQHHVGSAPTGIHHLERHFGFFPESPETSYMNRTGFGGVNLGPSSGGNYMMNVGPRALLHAGIPGNMPDSSSPSFRMMSSPRHSPVFLGNGPYPGLLESERSRSRRMESNSNQVDAKKQFLLDLDKIAAGEDSRTTLMIKNIPNKYTSKMLLSAIDENHKGTYDFLYLPIDFKNKCNVGYAFINMLSPAHIIPFYEAFNGKKWEKFNSEKVASLAYARIQGRSALIAHFQNSSLMNEDKRCRPILFHSESTDDGEQIVQEHLPSLGSNNQICQNSGSDSGESSGNSGKDGLEEKPGQVLFE